jgi:hypothetical protein
MRISNSLRRRCVAAAALATAAALWGPALASAADYDGDNRTDFAVWRPSSGTSFVIRSSDGGIKTQQWGSRDDIPVAGDYDGDRRTDFAVWRPSSGTWFVIRSSDGGIKTQQWGSRDDIPVAGSARLMRPSRRSATPSPEGRPPWASLRQHVVIALPSRARVRATALAELQTLASGILPPILADHGRHAAIEDLASRAPLTVQVEEMAAGRLALSVEVADLSSQRLSPTSPDTPGHRQLACVSRAATVDCSSRFR